MMQIMKGQRTGVTRILSPIKQEPSEVPIYRNQYYGNRYNRDVLENMSMAELRDVANALDAKTARSKKAIIANILATVEV